MLVSVHIPKTAGTSFLTAIEQHYGQGLLRDYDDMPVNHSRFQCSASAAYSSLRNQQPGRVNKDVACIHGHFLPLKYRFLYSKTPVKYVVWMRNPVDRLFSHYRYWVQSYDAELSGRLHKKVVEQQWSLEAFCHSSEMRNLYSRFFWGFPLGQFDFIGITEHYDSEIEYFSRNILGSAIANFKVNVNSAESLNEEAQYPEMRESVQKYHDADMVLYQRALEIRDKRNAAQGVSPE